MKINAKVTAVEERPGSVAQSVLAVRMTGYAEAQEDWKGKLSYKLEVPSNSTSQRTYHVGREIIITIEPKP